MEIKHMAFLEALFTEVTSELESYEPDTREGIASRWYQWLKEGATIASNGKNRIQLYQRVVSKEVCVFSLLRQLRSYAWQIEKLDGSIEYRRRLEKAVNTFVRRLRELYSGRDPYNTHAIVYFDEANVLHPSWALDHQTSYAGLMRVLRYICGRSIFFVFLSSSPRLLQFGATKICRAGKYPPYGSPNDLYGDQQPFFELSFDTFSRRFTSEAKESGKLTLSGVCELGQITKFGRPMYVKSKRSLLNICSKTFHSGGIPIIKVHLTHIHLFGTTIRWTWPCSN
jgi:hypothetical protein